MPPRDGFEGAGTFAELLVAILVTVVLLFVTTILRKLLAGANTRLPRGRYIWAFAICLCRLCDVRFCVRGCCPNG